MTTPRISPIAPTVAALSAASPAGATVLVDGFWADRQRTNAEISLVHGWHQLDASGALPNFAAAQLRRPAQHRGECNQDAEVYKWVEAASYEVARTGSAGLARLLDQAVRTIAAAQEPDGYLHTWYQLNPQIPRLGGLTDGGPDETYTAGHLIHAAVAHHRATGRTELLDVATAVARRLDDDLVRARPQMVTGHPGLETALVELYRETGDRRPLEMATHLVDARGYGVLGGHRFGSSHYQDDLPVRTRPALTGHAVAALYLMCGATDVATETRDTGLLDAVERLWEHTVATKSYLTGGLGSRARNEDFGDDYELGPDSSYCETCAAVAMVMWSWRLLLATGRARYADVIERTAFNALLVGVSLDGTAFRYDNQLQVRQAHRTPAGAAGLERTAWFALACCPPNVMRLLASWGHYQAAFADDGSLVVHQLASIDVRWDEDTVLEVRTAYPWDGRVEMTYRGGPARRAVRVRVPGWCREVTVDDARVEPVDGYVTLVRDWGDGTTVTLRLTLAPRLTVAHPRVDAVRGCAAVEVGPIVYCVERGSGDLDVDGLRLSPRPEEITSTWDERDRHVVLGLPTAQADLRPWDGTLYMDQEDAGPVLTHPTTTRALPYYAWGNRGAGPMRVWIPLEVTP